MFNKIKKTTILAFLIINIGLSFSCKNAPIFAAIEKEVKLKNFSVKGNLIGFVEIDGTVYTANPENVFRKSKGSTNSWNAIGCPGKIALKLATDGKNLFVSLYKGGIYYYASGWKKVAGSDGIEGVFGSSTVFGYGNGKVYKITTSGVTPIQTSNIVVGAAGKYFATSSNIYSYNGSTATDLMVTTLKDKGIKNIKDMCQDENDNNVFILAGNTLYHYDGTNLTSKGISGKTPKSISYFKVQKKVLIGCTDSYTEIQLSTKSGKSPLGEGSVQLNPGATGSTTPPSVASQYDSTIGNYSVSPIFATGTSDSYSIFAGILAGNSIKYTGLWGYYSSGKQEWNRE